MTPGALPLTTGDLVIAASLILVAGAISLVLRLGLEKKLALASVRTVVQLLLVGHILGVVFEIAHPLPLFLVLGIMIALAGRAALDRASRTVRGAYFGAFVTLTLAGLTTTFTATSVIVGVQPWYLPQYVIPLLGMVLGNTLTGLSLSIDALLERLDVDRDLIEADLALGATRWEAASDTLSAAVRRGMIPMINAMMVVGVVSLPGMMTGQILQGADPLNAVKYQIMIMFMLAFAVAVGSMMMAFFLYRRLFNDRHQLLVEAIEKKRE